MNIVPFTFTGNRKTIFKTGAVSLLADEASFFGKKMILFTGGSSLKKRGALARIEGSLKKAGFDYSIYNIASEPEPDVIDAITSEISGASPDVIAAVGGGSVIDAGKAVSAMLCEDGLISEFLEGIGSRTPSGKKIPFIAVPTTAGTGSEATRNAVIRKLGPNGFKKSLRHFNYTPDIAIIDPELFAGCPRPIAAASGMDALSQLIEAYISVKATFYTDIHVVGAIDSVFEALPVVAGCKRDEEFCDSDCADAWQKMAYASYISGTALANCGYTIIHGIAGPLGGYFDASHGAICGTLLASGIKHTVEKLEKTAPDSPALLKIAKIGYIAVGSDDLLPKEARSRLIQVLEGLTENLQIPRLSSYGISEADLPFIAGAASNKNNPVELDKNEIISFLSERL